VKRLRDQKVFLLGLNPNKQIYLSFCPAFEPLYERNGGRYIRKFPHCEQEHHNEVSVVRPDTPPTPGATGPEVRPATPVRNTSGRGSCRRVSRTTKKNNNNENRLDRLPVLDCDQTISRFQNFVASAHTASAGIITILDLYSMWDSDAR